MNSAFDVALCLVPKLQPQEWHILSYKAPINAGYAHSCDGLDKISNSWQEESLCPQSAECIHETGTVLYVVHMLSLKPLTGAYPGVSGELSLRAKFARPHPAGCK